ncbi:E3 SUMO-protein ligase ZBED1-like [Paralichthys olivaceus]|uniref:E3 SUMO-protein ligase ZBED1-like n=1 Tax=Paralichthys olivaceus TaxID=8255 RepID=UPI0037510D0D
MASMEMEREHARKRSATQSEEEHPVPLIQGSVAQYFRGSTPTITQERFDKLILNFIIQGLHPLHTVERPEYRDLFREILPSRHLISRRTLGRMLEDEHLSMKSKLTETLSKQNHVCTTTDAWSSNNKSFLGVTIHWINQENLSICSGALACRRIIGRHTYDVLAEMLEDVHRDFNIKDKVTVTTTDNGSNFVKAFSVFAEVQRTIQDREEEYEEEEEGHPVFINVTDILHEEEEDYSLPPHQRCACHTLNLVATRDIEDALTQSEPFKKISRSTMGKCQALWNKQHRSTQASDIIKDKLGCQLTVPSPTRWNSTYHAMERLSICILTKEQDLQETCEKLQVTRFKAAELTFIREYVQVMAPLAKALDVLQSDRMAYTGVLVPTISILVEKMERMKHETNLHHCYPLVDAIISGVKQRFGYIFQDARLLIASAVHPMFRLAYIPSGKKADVVSNLKAEVNQLQTQSPDDHMQTDGEDPTVDSDEVPGYFPSLKTTVLNEVDSYLQSTETKLVNAFQNLPMMKMIFLKYNTGVPASAACERLFSVGKDIFRPKRNRLSDANFEKLLLCRVNKHLL